MDYGNRKAPLQGWKGLEIVGVDALRFRPLVPRRFQNSIGMAGFLARGSSLLRAFPGIPSGMMRSRYSLTVAGQRGSLTLFPFNRTRLRARHQTGWSSIVLKFVAERLAESQREKTGKIICRTAQVFSTIVHSFL
jgi:hypothetical protein